MSIIAAKASTKGKSGLKDFLLKYVVKYETFFGKNSS
jgi:hypothetical protein